MMRALPLALAATFACTLAACVTAPAPLQGEYAALTPDQAVASTGAGTAVRWGGRIVEVTPEADRTCFQVLSMPLDSSGRPGTHDNRSGGRFIACRAGFYDPALFTSDREITFTGRIAGTETVRVGEYDYRLPRIDADVVYLWPERADVQVIHYEPYPWGPGWWW